MIIECGHQAGVAVGIWILFVILCVRVQDGTQMVVILISQYRHLTLEGLVVVNQFLARA